MKNEWLTIDGKQVLWDEFAYILDDYRSRIKRQYGNKIYNRFCYMISPIQEMADIYHNRPEDWPADYVLEELEEQEFPKLKNNELPDAIGETFDQMVKILGIDSEAMLSICVEKSQISYQKKLKAEEEEKH
ncbi:MAG: hypothetical protein LUI14_06290 [Lachnospiraceae bacterium]|nr:hypothetical protein [Lachnospiraceae bacterium]